MHVLGSAWIYFPGHARICGNADSLAGKAVVDGVVMIRDRAGCLNQGCYGYIAEQRESLIGQYTCMFVCKCVHVRTHTHTH